MAAHPWVQQATFASFFIGGGTPTIYDEQSLYRILSKCLRLFTFTEQPEITIEANPNTLSFAKLTALKEAGINRLSIGIQSFSDRLLRILGRSHTKADALTVLEMARRAGFANISMDLIYGLPEQDVEDWQHGLETAGDFGPEHFSLYELTIEKDTPFGLLARQGKLQLPEEDTVIAMEGLTRAFMGEKGFEQYEISNYSRPGFRCGHNINYWRNGSYLGLGAAAVSCLSGLRIRNIADPAMYCRLLAYGDMPFDEGEFLAKAARFRETVIMGLRMLEGVDINTLKERFGISIIDYYGQNLKEFLDHDLVELDQGFLRLTINGLPVANQVLAKLV